MPFAVLLTVDAARDLEDLYQYIAVHDAPGKADHVLTNIEKVFGSLSEFPERGVYPKELLALGIRDYREIFFKPYRLIYRVAGCRTRLSDRQRTPRHADLAPKKAPLCRLKTLKCKTPKTNTACGRANGPRIQSEEGSQGSILGRSLSRDCYRKW
jgi:toxin ParE1/3/4